MFSPLRFCSYFTDPPIKVLVGNERTPYYVPAGILLAHGESAISTRLRGPWKDKSEAALDWTDTDIDTFGRIIAFFITGQYSVASCAPLEPEAEDGHIDVLASSSVSIQKEHLNPKLIQPDQIVPYSSNWGRLRLHECLGLDLPAYDTRTIAGILTDISCDKFDFGAALFEHAKVYVFAHRNLVSQLEKYALRHLLHTLVLAEEKQASNFTGLAHAVHQIYNNIPEESLQVPPVRKLFSLFVARNYTRLADEDLAILLSEGGDFGVDLSAQLNARITAADTYRKLSETMIGDLKHKISLLQIELNAKEVECGRMRETLAEQDRKYGSLPGLSKKGSKF
ncbi:hypothetical protein K432DRAFT_411318 [Lepidopterella palustris CBS 459.81]|uniref:BTB domain-containing protein n=1 Tax=Lepidopterella palustris CBS 459.81 TaxID=1314670 RepID=A0A8E2DWH7_9PEZI|nr:hypothetical protein K432DRAFT_411318 [Lepidopterella palustris CBS 459.81]